MVYRAVYPGGVPGWCTGRSTLGSPGPGTTLPSVLLPTPAARTRVLPCPVYTQSSRAWTTLPWVHHPTLGFPGLDYPAQCTLLYPGLDYSAQGVLLLLLEAQEARNRHFWHPRDARGITHGLDDAFGYMPDTSCASGHAVRHPESCRLLARARRAGGSPPPLEHRLRLPCLTPAACSCCSKTVPDHRHLGVRCPSPRCPRYPAWCTTRARYCPVLPCPPPAPLQRRSLSSQFYSTQVGLLVFWPPARTRDGSSGRNNIVGNSTRAG